jgi:hypothetical protein
MSIQSNFPALDPTLLLDFANTEQLDPRITFTRASTATYYGTQTAKAEENLLRFSQEFETAGWGGVGTTATANTQTAPDGTSTADVLTATAATSVHNTSSATVSLTAASHAYSVFVKAGTNNFVQLRFGAPFGAQFANFDLSAGTVGTSSGGTAAITSVGNGWYRCSLIATTLAASSAVQIYIVSSASAAQAESWTTAGTETIFLWGAQLEQRSAVTAYTATTTQPITNYIPVLETAASGVARFDHNPTTFESLGLLIEEQRTNLLLYSEEFDNGAWGKNNVTVSANAILAPSNATTADKIIENTVNGNHRLEIPGSPLPVLANSVITLSIFAKAAERNFIRVSDDSGSSAWSAFFNIANGTIGDLGSASTATITPVGNGWYRCALTYTTTTTFVRGRFGLASGNGTSSYTGDGTSGAFFWGTQLELGTLTSYIPTVASQVTRATDAASMTGTNFSSWYNAAEGTMYAESATTNPSAVSSTCASIFASASNFQRIRHVGSLIDITATSAGVSVVDTEGVAVSVGSFGKTSLGYKTNDYAQFTNGTSGGVDSSASLPTGLNVLNIGSTDGTSNNLNGHIRKIAYYPLRVTNANLQALTS